MEKRRHWSHDPCEHLRGSGEAKTESYELVDSAVDNESQKLPAVQVNRNMKVSIFEIDGDHPVKAPDGLQYRLVRLHLERRQLDETVQKTTGL